MGRRVTRQKAEGISTRLLAVMEHRGIGIPALAKASGERHKTLAKRINEQTFAGKGLLKKLAPVLGVPLAWLDAGSPPSPPWYSDVSSQQPVREEENEKTPIPNAKISQQVTNFQLSGAYMVWREQLEKRWNDFVCHQSDPFDTKVATAMGRWPEYHRSAVYGIYHCLSLAQCAELSSVLNVTTPSISDLHSGKTLHWEAAREFETLMFGTPAEKITKGDFLPVYFQNWDLTGSIGICQQALEHLSKRRKLPNGVGSINDLAIMRSIIGKIDSSKSIEMLTSASELPNSTFPICLEAFVALRDYRINRKSDWSDVETAMKALFQFTLSVDRKVPLMTAVKQHRRMVAGKALTPIPHTADAERLHRVLNVWATFDGKIVPVKKVELRYRQRGLDKELLITDLELLSLHKCVTHLCNDYIRFIDAPYNITKYLS